MLVSLTLFVLVLGACSARTDKDVLFIRYHLEDYKAETVPYEEEIQFTLTTEEILDGIEKPQEIASVYDTDVFVYEVKKRENKLNSEQEILISVGFDGNIHEKGTLLTTFQLNKENNTYTTSPSFKKDIRAYNERGELGDYGGGVGDSEGRFQQEILYVFQKEELQESKEWTFEIEGLTLLKYQEK